MKLVDFAAAIGLSKTTVSDAIAGRGRVKPQTRQYVLNRMTEFGYSPNPNARALASGSSGMIGITSTTREILSDAFSVEMARHLQAEVMKYGYTLLLDAGLPLNEAARFVNRWVESEAVDGIIWFDEPSVNPEWVHTAFEHRTVVVSMGSWDTDHPGTGWANWDVDSGIGQAVGSVLSLGHKHIGFVGVFEKDPVLESIKRHLTLRDIELSPDMIQLTHNWNDDGVEATTSLLNSTSPPTVIFARRDLLAIKAISVAMGRGMRIPDDLSIVGFDGIAMGSIVYPPLTTVELNCEDMARGLVKILVSLIQHPEIHPEPYWASCSYLPRGTVGQVPPLL